MLDFFHCCDKHVDTDDDLNYIKSLKLLLDSVIQSQQEQHQMGCQRKGDPRKLDSKVPLRNLE